MGMQNWVGQEKLRQMKRILFRDSVKSPQRKILLESSPRKFPSSQIILIHENPSQAPNPPLTPPLQKMSLDF